MLKKFYITTAIAYVNAPPHIGHLLELLQADVLARYHRLQNQEVYFLTGVDEHGTKILQTAKSQKITPKELADKNAELFNKLTKTYKISNDDFIRTSDQKRHWPAAQKIWQQLQKSGDLYKKKYRGLYCVGHESFIKESELENGLCPDHKSKPEVLEEENWFFKLSKYQDKLHKLIHRGEIKIIPESRKNEILSFINQGLEDVSFSRPKKNLFWGIPVPDDSDQVMYVWADALTNYISALGYAENSDKFKKFWPADLHVIGKDILRFHALIWPAMLLSAKLPLPKSILVHGFITSSGQKMSKSIGNVIDPFDLVEKYPIDAVRYFLLREIPTTGDGDFSYEKLIARYNGDLADGLGNLVARVLTLAEKNQWVFEKDFKENKVTKKVLKKTWQNYEKAIQDYKFNEALSEIWQLVSNLDERIDKIKLWELIKQNKEKFANELVNILVALANIASALEPFLPETADKIFEQLGIDKKSDEPWHKQFKIKKGTSLFPRL